MARLSFYFAGLLFAIGLGVAGMTQPAKIVGFLDFTGSWDPSLAFVMLGAIGVHAATYRSITKRQTPLFAARFLVPTRRDVDVPLVVGSVIFGVGWGLGGFCPGPAITSLGAASGDAVLFIATLLVGHWAFAGYSRLRSSFAARAAERTAARSQS